MPATVAGVLLVTGVLVPAKLTWLTRVASESLVMTLPLTAAPSSVALLVSLATVKLLVRC